jgi:MYXO-CTERM domain-containing protein
MKKLSFLIASILSTAAAHGATVNWGATNSPGTGIVDGATDLALAQGDAIHIGYFTISDSSVAALANPTSANLTTLNSSWVDIADSTIGTGTSTNGIFSQASTPTLSGAAFGHQIYVWAWNASTLGGTTQQAIFYEPSSSNSSWNFPGSNLASTTIDINQAASGTFLAGTYEASNASISAILGAGSGAVQLQAVVAVPEPSSFTFGALAALAAAGTRRRRRA